MAHPNKYKYLKAPTIEQIDAAIKKADVPEIQFERYNHIPEGTICQIRLGYRNLPAHFWHIIFEGTSNSTRFPTRSPLQTPAQRQRPKAASRLAGLS